VTVESEPFAIFDDPRGVDFTIGVEEEFFVVDRESRALRTDVDVVLDRSDAPEGNVIDHELKRSQAETGTAVCEDLGAVRASVTELRRRLAVAAESIGGRLLASGTHPFAHWSEDGGVTPDLAYVRLEETYGQLTVEQAVCGCHVHVGVRDPDLVVEVMNRARAWVPLLVALSANSPFWMGEDSRYASYRTEVFHRWPTAGIPEHFEDRAAYDQVVADLRATGAIDGPARLYWDIRPSARYPTLEFRASDVMMTVDEAVALAGVIRAIVETCHAEALAGAPFEVPRPELLRAALWRAARFGLSDRLIDLDAMQAVPAADVVTGSLQRLRPVLERRGAWDEVESVVAEIVRFGPGAERQRAARMQTGDLERVVDAIADATTAGTGLP
jgi:glutamate---cysteine ligase / carboxylate-amine ligase